MKYIVTMMVDEDIYDELRAYSNDRVHIFFADSEEEAKRDIKERLMVGQQQCILDGKTATSILTRRGKVTP